MFLIAPGVSSFHRALIANGLSYVAANGGEESIIADFSVAGNEVFWSVYKNGTKYVEDILPALAGINAKMLKNFLAPQGANLTLGLKETKIDDIPIESVLYLLNALQEEFRHVFVILPDENKAASFEFIKRAKCVLLPFMSDSVSSKYAMQLADFYYANSQIKPAVLPLKLDIGYEFHSEAILKASDLFNNCLSAEFDSKIQEQIISPRFSYRDKNSALAAAYKKALEFHDRFEAEAQDKESDKDKFFKNESVYSDLRNTIHAKLVEEMKAYVDETDGEKLKRTAKIKIDEIVNRLSLKIPQSIYDRLIKELGDDVAGLGVLEDFLKDESITEIMVNGPDSIYIEKAGKLSATEVTFPDEKRLKTVIDRIVSQVGRHIDEASPIVDARLKDGSRVNAVIRPISLNGPVLTIRKFLKNKLSADSLVSSGSVSEAMVEFLKTAVILKRNIIISGGTGTGKTTLLNAVSSFIPEKERLVTIEDSAELQLQQKHVVRMESRPKSTEGTGEVNIRRLVVNSLRMRPDRIIVGECRAGEALDMIQAMSTGHEGSMTTLHANSPQDAISRLVTMVLMSGMDLPERSIVSQIASAINVIIQLTRYSDGSRKISSISVLNKTDSDKIYEVKPVFQFELAGFENGMQQGEFKATGLIPDFIKDASKRGIKTDMGIFK